MQANITNVLGLAIIAGCIAVQLPSRLVYSSGDLARSAEPVRSAPNRTAGERAPISYGDLPLSFEVNRGQTDARVEFLARASGYTLYLTAKETVMSLHAPARPFSKNEHRPSATTTEQLSFIGMRLVGANTQARIFGVDELPGKSNYFIGSDPKKWRLNVPNYSRVMYQNAYPGLDVVFYGKGRQLEYDFIVAPGASLKPIKLAFDGARRVRLDESGDLVIETSAGEIRQRKPAIYQQVGAKRIAISGGYVITGDREVAFEVGAYDRTLALVIDPVLVYSTSIGGIYNDNANAVAVDASGNAYIAGTTTSTDFPTVNPFQPGIGRGQVIVGISSDAFVAKLNPSGTALLYSTYLGGAGDDGANGIAVDAAGDAYVTGVTRSNDFASTPNAFQTKPVTGGAAFITKFNAAGNALVYSTYLGGSTFETFLTANVGTSIAVDAGGNAYVTGHTFSRDFPIRKGAQAEFNRGAAFNCCFECLYNFQPSPSPVEDAFVTKLNPSGSGLIYSTYLGGSGQDESFAIAVDSTGSAYVTGRTCSRDFTSGSYGGGISDAFVVKLSPSGREFVYSKFLGGVGDDSGNGIAVDSAGNAYVAGQTDSVNFPVTQNAFQQTLGGSVVYAAFDGGNRWNPASGLPNSSVNALAIDPVDPSTIYAGLGSCSQKATGVYKSTDGGGTWRSAGLESYIIQAIAVDPARPSTVYAGPNKSTDGGVTWIRLNLDYATSELVIDPVTPTTLYAISEGFQCGDGITVPTFTKSTDGGTTWKLVRNGGSIFGGSSLAYDPKNPTTLYVIGGNLFESTDGGTSWRKPYEGNRNFARFVITATESTTIYLIDHSSNLLKSTDRGRTFVTLAHMNSSIAKLLVDPTNSSVLYAAVSSAENSGGVLKSTDGGQTWNSTDLIGMAINTLAIDPQNSQRVLAGAHFDVDGFLVKSNSAGGSLIYSNYLGTRSPDMAAGIGVDEAGNAYLTGRTFSDRFPTIDTLQLVKPSGPVDAATFATKMNSTGSAILFSTYLGGSEPNFGSAIAVDKAGKIFIAGTAGQPAIVPSARLPESAHGGADAFVVKIASTPRITGASISGESLVVAGEGFDQGAVILVDGVEQRTRNYELRPATALIGRKSGKNIAPGHSVTIRVRNSDGLISEPFSFTR